MITKSCNWFVIKYGVKAPSLDSHEHFGHQAKYMKIAFQENGKGMLYCFIFWGCLYKRGSEIWLCNAVKRCLKKNVYITVFLNVNNGTLNFVECVLVFFQYENPVSWTFNCTGWNNDSYQLLQKKQFLLDLMVHK